MCSASKRVALATGFKYLSGRCFASATIFCLPVPFPFTFCHPPCLDLAYSQLFLARRPSRDSRVNARSQHARCHLSLGRWVVLAKCVFAGNRQFHIQSTSFGMAEDSLIALTTTPCQPPDSTLSLSGLFLSRHIQSALCRINRG